MCAVHTFYMCACRVVALYAGRGKGESGDGFVTSAAPGEAVGVILNATPFYAEQGGQVYMYSAAQCLTYVLLPGCCARIISKPLHSITPVYLLKDAVSQVCTCLFVHSLR